MGITNSFEEPPRGPPPAQAASASQGERAIAQASIMARRLESFNPIYYTCHWKCPEAVRREDLGGFDRPEPRACAIHNGSASRCEENE
jgi:hypothetical protein